MIERDIAQNKAIQLFSANIRLHRISRNLNQTEFGKLLGIAQNGISKMERGVYAPTLAQLYKISSGLKEPVSALFGYNRPDKIYRTYRAFRLAFSERLKRIRLERNLSQKELAEKVGMKQPTYNVIEVAKRTRSNPDRIVSPDLETISHIAAALHVETTALLFD